MTQTGSGCTGKTSQWERETKDLETEPNRNTHTRQVDINEEHLLMGDLLQSDSSVKHKTHSCDTN